MLSMATFSEKQTFRELRSFVRSTAIATDDTDAAYGSGDNAGNGQVVFGRFVDAGGGARQFNELARADVSGWSLVFHDNTLVCGSSRDIVLFDVSAGTLNRRGVLQGHTRYVRGVAAHGDWLASSSYDETVRIWSMTTREQLHCKTDHTSWVRSVCFSYNGRWLVSGSYDNSVIVYDATRDFARHTTLTLDEQVSAVCFSPDDSMLAVGADNGASAIYSVDTFEPLRTLAGGHWVSCVAWLGNAAALLVGGTIAGELVVWNTSTGNVTSQQMVHESMIYSLSFTNSFLTLLTGSYETALVFDVYFHHESCATTALYSASLHVFRTLRRTNLATLAMQLIAEWLAGESASLEPLSEHERTRIFTASRVTSDVRATRLATLRKLNNFHARMHWLRTSTPAYAGNELEPLGSHTYRVVAAPPSTKKKKTKNRRR